MRRFWRWLTLYDAVENVHDLAVGRLMIICCGVIYPGWSLYTYLATPWIYDRPAERICVGIFLISMWLLSYTEKFKGYIYSLLTPSIFIVIIHYFSLMYRTSDPTPYAAGLFVVVGGTILFIPSVKILILYSLLCVVLMFGYNFSNPSDWGVVMNIIGGIPVLQFMAIVLLREKLAMRQRLEEYQAERLSFHTKEAEVKTRMKELGHVAVRLGDKIKNPLGIIQMAADYGEEILRQSQIDEREKKMEELFDKIRRNVREVATELRDLDRFKEHAQKDDVNRGF